MKTKKKKPISISTLRTKLWSITSEYVRYAAADYNGYVACVTCGVIKFWQGDGMQCGHWIPKARGNATAWDLRNLNPQCSKCNVLLGSNGPEYYPYMLATYGQAVVDELRQLCGASVKLTRTDYLEMIDERAGLLADLVMSRKRGCDIPRLDIK
jgi:hypothetical protein